MGIDFSKFTQEIQAKIKSALEDTKSPEKIDAAEFRAMNLEKEVANKLMQELAGNSEYIGDGYFKAKNKNKMIILLEQPENNSIIPLTQDSLSYYQKLYPDKNIAKGVYNDGVLYLADSSGKPVKDRFGNYISEKITFKEYKPEIEDVSGNFEVIDNEPVERTNRRFVSALVRSMYNEVIQELKTVVSQMGVLDVGLWREALGMGIQAIADLKENQELITATTEAKIKRIEVERDNVCESLDTLLDSPEEFASKFYQLFGKDYRDNAFQELRDIQHNQDNKTSGEKFRECVSRFNEQFPENNISKNIEGWKDSVEYQKTIDEIANIVVMFVMTGGIGKLFQGSVQTLAKNILLAAAKGDKKAVFANFAKLAPEVQTVWKSLAKKEFGVAAAQTITPMAQSSATMGSWEGVKAFLNNLTNAEEMSPEELLSRTLEGLKSGIEMGFVMGGLETFAIAPAISKLTPMLNKLTGATSEITGLIEKGNGTVSMEKIMETYAKANEALKGKIVKEGTHTLVSLPVLTTGFTITDTTFHYDEKEFRKSLLDAASTEEEREAIRRMSSVDLRIEFAKTDFINQVKGMATIEGIGIIFRRLQAGRIAAKSMKQNAPDILGANLRTVKENGKTVYEICTPEGEVIPIKQGDKNVSKFTTIEQASAAYSALCVELYTELIDIASKKTEEQLSNTGEKREQLPSVKPKVFKSINPDGNIVLDEYAGKEYPYYDDYGDFVEFSKESGAKTLTQSKLPKDEQIIEISNFVEPCGTVAGSSNLNQTLLTGDLMQCSAIAIVDKANNKQTLIHLDPGLSIEDNKQIIQYIVSQSKPEDLEVSVVSGFNHQAPRTVQFVLDTFNELLPDVKVNLFRFDKQSTIVVLKDGKLTCCTQDACNARKNNIVTNPKENITYCTKEEIETKEVNIFENSEVINPLDKRLEKGYVTDLKANERPADTRYSKPITLYTELGNKIFEVKPDDVTENPEKITGLQAEIENLRKTEPQKAEELQIVLDMFTNPTKVQDVTDKQIDAVVNYLNDHYDNLENYITEQTGEIGISDKKLGRFGHRIKGEWSTRDKIANYIKDSIKEEIEAKENGEEYTTKTLLDAYKDVRDKYACRTVFETGDFTKHPEVKRLIEEAKSLANEGKAEQAALKMHEAELKAAELQSEPVRLQILEAMRKAKQEGKDLTAIRISNYASENGIPIFTPEQMNKLKLEAAEMGVNVEFIKLAKEIDPKATTEFVEGASTKQQPSGYTALQINFVTKTGEVIEWQYRGELVNNFAEAEHLPYDIRTGKQPWRQYPELETLYKPIADLLGDDVMPKHAYKQLNKYFTDYYTHLRRLELGFESVEPKLEDYENYTDKDGIKHSFKFDKRLEAKNLERLHYYGEGIKDGIITPERALEEFNAEIEMPKKETQAADKNQQLLKETVDALKQLGASDRQIEEFKANCDDEVLSFVQERLNSPDFSPFADGYLKSLNKYNLALMKKLSSDPNFNVLSLGLVASAAYNRNYAIQIEAAFDKGTDIIPGCQRIVQVKAKAESAAQDPAVIARKQAYENAQTRIMENTALSKRDVHDLGDWADIREESIQDLIIYCEKNGIKGYQNLLHKCSENREGDRYPTEVVKKNVEFALRGLENKLEPSEISSILFQYDKNDIDTINKMFDTAIEERRIELQKQAEKELAISNKKNEIREKYNNSDVSNVIERILNSEKLPEELLFKIDELLGDTPNGETCKFLFDCIEKIDAKKFDLNEFINNFNSELKLPNLAECKITEFWKTEAENCTKRQINSDYLVTLTNSKGEPLFNSKMIAAVEELAKTNPKAANLIVDKCIKNPDFARPFIVVHLCNAVKTDANLAFSILNMKNNNGSARFEGLKLAGILSAIPDSRDLIIETVKLEQLGNVRLSYATQKMDNRSNDPYKFVKYEVDDLRNEFAVEVGRYLETKRTVNGREMYNPYWDIREYLYDALKTNPEVAIHYLNKNSSSDYRTVFDGRKIKALVSLNTRLEKFFRERLDSLINDEDYIETDHILDEVLSINESNSKLAERLYLDLNLDPKDVRNILRNNDSYPIDFFNDEICEMLQRIKNNGADISKTLFALFNDSISQKLPDKIQMLLTLQMLTAEDIQVLKKHGIDVNKKIEIFQNSIDRKHPIIETQPENARAILKALANNGNADEVVQNVDFSMFEQNGIRLQYTREEFMRKMADLTAKYQASFDDTNIDVEIPALKLNEEQVAKTQDVIKDLRSKCQIKEYTFVINGKECTVERFLKSKKNGSNDGDFALIDGKLYYIKFPSSDKLGQSVEEVIASQLYRAAGIDAPNETYLVDKNGVVRGMASEYIPEMQKLPNRSMLFDSFATDAWLANWDAPKNDNTQVYGDGQVIKSDVGGALHYRAQGEMKVDFGNIVNELVSLIENNSVYSNMSKADLLKSLEHVSNIPNEAIFKIIKDSPNSDCNLLNTLLKRKEFIQIFAEKVKTLDETKFNNILLLIKEAKRLALQEFDNTPDIAGILGYTPTRDGFEGLLNTQDLSNRDFTPEQRAIADEMIAEIRRFTVDNRLADDIEVSQETRDFINSILQGVPEFASYFGKPQHGNGNVDANGKQISGHQYPLDIHILKVLQSSVKDPWYSKTDNYGKRILDDESRIVLKFSALLHDIGKKYLTGRDAGHAALSAEYVYSILDRFNLPTRTKNRIINMVNNHHWLEAYCKGQITDETVATMFRTTEDFTIARIMARADLENVREGFLTKTMMADYPNEVHNAKEAYQKFEQIMDHIQSKVDIIEKNQPIVTPSKFVEVPERVTSDGRVIARRGFPIVQKMLDGKMETFKVLDLHNLDPETDMYQYGFGHIKLKDLRLLVHRAGDGNRNFYNSFKILGANPQNTSLQSISLIKATKPGTYVGMNWSFIVEGNNNNIGVAFYENAQTGRLKTLKFMVDEFFGNGKKNFKPNDPRRTFFKDSFINYFKNKGIEVDDKTYTAIVKYVRNKQYIETQIKDLKIGDKIFKKEDLVEGLLFARDALIEKRGYTEHNEETMMDCKPVAGGIAAESFDHVADDFLRICRDNCDGKMIIW